MGMFNCFIEEDRGYLSCFMILPLDSICMRIEASFQAVPMRIRAVSPGSRLVSFAYISTCSSNVIVFDSASITDQVDSSVKGIFSFSELNRMR